MAGGFASVGHSNRSLEEFLDMLRAAQIGVVADVRSFPKSRSNPVFNTDTLPGDLETVQIGYRHIPDLGGRRPRQPDVDRSLNAWWRVQSFHNYADYALEHKFGAAFAGLVALGQQQKVAIMCAEAVWWRCHRRILADYLLAAGHPVEHLMGPGQTTKAEMTPGAQAKDGKLIYPAD